jgi:putative transposase
VIGTLRRDCLDHVIVWGERNATRVLKRYVGYYHGRLHRGIHMQSPDGVRHLPPTRPQEGAQIVTTSVLGGLHNRYGFPANRAPS